MPLTITGTLEEIREKLLQIRVIIEYRRYLGWPLFNSDEEWEYETKNDERVCYICLGYAGTWIGTQIPAEFSDYKTWGKAHVKPATHTMYPWLQPSIAPDAYGGCRCNLFWDDYLFVLKNRLFTEFEEAI